MFRERFWFVECEGPGTREQPEPTAVIPLGLLALEDVCTRLPRLDCTRQGGRGACEAAKPQA